jgi:hypothetical protein
MLLSSCASTISPKTGGVQSDTVALAATPLGLEVQEAKAGVRVEVLANPGDEITLKMGEQVRTVIADIDPDTEVVESVIDDDLGTICLRVASAKKNFVRLEKKCQTIERIGTGPLPSVELADGLHPEQIVITPLCDGAESVVGYSIRYGSEERGCRSEARSALRAFERCHGNRKQLPRSTKAEEPWRVLFRGKR